MGFTVGIKAYPHKAAGAPHSSTLPPLMSFEPHGPNCAVCTNTSIETSTDLAIDDDPKPETSAI